jgi:transposase
VRTGITVHLSPTDRKRLQVLVDDRNRPQKHVWRARIVLATTDGLGTAAIMRTAGVSKTAVWRWQQRFMEEGVEGLLRDKMRPARVPKLADEVAEWIVALTLGEPPGEITHWTGREMAKAAGVSLTSVQRIWKAHGPAPHRPIADLAKGIPPSSLPAHVIRLTQAGGVACGAIAQRGC